MRDRSQKNATYLGEYPLRVTVFKGYVIQLPPFI